MTATAGGTRELAATMVGAASNILATLSDTQKRLGAYAFDDRDERRAWWYTPNHRGGLPLDMMDPAQQRLTHQLVAMGLSFPGYVTAATIMGLENTLDAVEGWRMPWYGGRGRDVAKYYLSFFGEPGDDTWGWRFEGHHLSLRYTIANGELLTPTPMFFGADPAEAPFMGGQMLRPLGSVEDMGRELLHALDEQQLAQALISPKAPPDIVMSNRPAVEDGALPFSAPRMMSLPDDSEFVPIFKRADAALGLTPENFEMVRYSSTPKGVAGSALNASQRDLLDALIRQYIDRMPDAVAAQQAAKVTGDVLADTHFAWAGGLQRGQPHYYRVQGPRLLIEYDNTMRDVNHIHAVWRDPEGDFGEDVLARHYAQAH